MGGYRSDGPEPGRLAGTERERIQRELDAELDAHIAMRTEELVRQGMPPGAARAAAERRFGDVETARREVAARARRRALRARLGTALEAVRLWSRHAVRSARRAPGPTLLTTSIFALSVGLATATFTLVDHVLLRPLPYPAPDRLVSLQGVGKTGNAITRVSMADWVDWKEEARTLTSTALSAPTDVTVLTGDVASWAHAALSVGPLFETLGIPMQAGRALHEEDGQDRIPVVVVSRDFWLRTFGGDPDLASLDLTVNARRVQVVGVVAAGHEYPGGTDVWMPVPYGAQIGGSRTNINYDAVARLAPDATLDKAQADLSRIAAGIREADPTAIYSYGVRVFPLRDVVVGDSRAWLRLLLGAVLLVLVVACANLAGLALAEASRRSSDASVRLALGANRGQVLGEQLASHLLPALVGGTVGVLLAGLCGHIVLSVFDGHLPRTTEITFDARVAAFGLVSALFAGVASGLLPALRSSRAGDVGLGGSPRGGVKGGRGLPGAVMVGTEIALGIALLVGGGLLFRSLVRVTSRDLGYDPEQVAVLGIGLTAPEYRDMSTRLDYWDRVLATLRGSPDVAEAALGNRIPTGNGGTGFVELEGGSDPSLGAGYRVVTEGYFETLGIPLLRGRDFDRGDTRGSERVGLVNHAAAERFWPGQDPMGRRIKATSMEAYFNGGTADWIRVIGVVGDVRHDGFESDPDPEMFVLHRQMPQWTGFMAAVVKLRPGTQAGTLNDLRRTVRALDPHLAVDAGMLSDRLRSLLATRRLVLGVLAMFAATALLLVCLGVYGLVSFAVATRTREIAVRAALGAARVGILSLVMGGALRVVLAGVAAGLLGAYLLRRVLDSMMVGVATSDPATYLGAAASVVLITLVAALVPSLRATHLDPVDALRRD